jgi:hypothetical protein
MATLRERDNLEDLALWRTITSKWNPEVLNGVNWTKLAKCGTVCIQ